MRMWLRANLTSLLTGKYPQQSVVCSIANDNKDVAEAAGNVSALLEYIAGMGAHDQDITPQEHTMAQSAAELYLHDPRARWPIRLDGHQEDKVLFKLNWAKDKACEFDVVVRDSAGDVSYVRCSDREVMKPGHEVLFKASLSAFIPNSETSGGAHSTGPVFSVSYTVRGMTLLRRAPVVQVIKVEPDMLDLSDDDLDLTPMQ